MAQRQFVLRLHKELQEIIQSPDHAFYIAHDETDLTRMRALLIGSPGTP